MFFHPSEVLREYNILPKKSFGQNFIVHRPTLETIAKKVLIEKPATILEIGPGPGSLSQFLVKEVENLVLIEKDETFEKILEEKNKIIFMLQQRISELETKLQNMVALPDYTKEKQSMIIEKEKLEQKVSELKSGFKTEKMKSTFFGGFALVCVIFVIIMIFVTK